ncbi:MAG: hypothetical protein NTZ53_14270 [Cyanobacteria bacterium]|nr:hypothetical protein [Cyanobacteriota bacterium]
MTLLLLPECCNGRPDANKAAGLRSRPRHMGCWSWQKPVIAMEFGPLMTIDWLPSGNNSLLHPDFTRRWSGLAKFPVQQGF